MAWGHAHRKAALWHWRVLAMEENTPVLVREDTGPELFMSVVHGIFSVADTSGDGVVDQAELPSLLQMLQRELGIPVLHGERLKRESRRLMEELDRDRTETFGFAEFLAVLHREPYVGALPPGALRALLARGA